MDVLGIIVFLSGLFVTIIGSVFSLLRMEYLIRSQGIKISIFNPLFPYTVYKAFVNKMGKDNKLVKVLMKSLLIGSLIMLIGVTLLLIYKQMHWFSQFKKWMQKVSLQFKIRWCQHKYYNSKGCSEFTQIALPSQPYWLWSFFQRVGSTVLVPTWV